MKKIDLITGFLGSGKTTFLKKYAEYLLSIGEKVCILENDFGAVNVDMMLLNELRGDNLELEMVAGGCDRDCHKRRFKTKLIAMGMEDYTRIVIEPSGVFDVDELFDALYDEPICNWYEMGSVISIVDAKMDTTLSDSAKAVMANEIACAGKIVLSKIQNYDKAEITNTKQYIEDSLRHVGCTRDISDAFLNKDWEELTDDDFKAIMNSGYKKESFSKSLSDYEAFDTLCFLDERFTVKELLELSQTLLNNSEYGNVLRIKGFCLEKDGWQENNAEKTNTNISRIKEGQDVIIIIGEGLMEEKIKEVLKKLRKPSKI